MLKKVEPCMNALTVRGAYVNTFVQRKMKSISERKVSKCQRQNSERQQNMN